MLPDRSLNYLNHDSRRIQIMNGCNQFRFHFRGFCLQINFKDFENEQSVCQLVNRQVVGWLG